MGTLLKNGRAFRSFSEREKEIQGSTECMLVDCGTLHYFGIEDDPVLQQAKGNGAQIT